MRNPVKLLSCLGVIVTLLTLSACSTPATPTPTQTSEPSATPAPSDTPAPTEPPMATDTPGPTAAPVLTGTLATLPPVTMPAITQGAGITSTAPAPASSVPDKALFVTQNFPDGTRFRPGTTVTIIWTVKNNGSTGWSTSYTLRYFAGEKSTKDIYPFPKTVSPGGEVDLSVTLAVPTVLGTYTTWWKLANGLGQNFSDVDFKFISATTAGAPLPTPTP